MNINAINVLDVKEIGRLDVDEATKHRISDFAISKGWKPASQESFYVPHEEVIANLLLEREFHDDAVEYIKQLFKYGSHHLSKLTSKVRQAVVKSWQLEKDLVRYPADPDSADPLMVFLPRGSKGVSGIDQQYKIVASQGNLVHLGKNGSSHTVLMDEAGGVLISENRGENIIRACGFGNAYFIASSDDVIFVEGSVVAAITGDNAVVKVVDGRSATYLTGKDVDVIVNIEDPVEGIDNGVIIATEGFGVINIKSPIPRLEVNDRYDVFFEGNRVNLPDGASYYILNYNYDAGKYQVEVIY